MSRLNTMHPDDKFLKNISDMMGKLDNKNEREIKQEIEQIGYKEFYRYYKEKDVYIKQLKEKINGVYEERTYLYNKLSAEKEQLNSLVNSCQEEIRQLKKQLTTYKILHRDCNIDNLKNISKIEEKETQQKEFIKWLEDYLKLFDKMDIDAKISYDMLEEILQKYKEIIGDDK